jgi:hypothetical protein
LFQANRWDWQPHRKLGTKYLVVLCAGSSLPLAKQSLDETPYKLSEVVAKPAGFTFSRIKPPTGLITLVSYWGKNLLLYSSNLALGVSNWPVIYFINYTPTSSLALFITAPSFPVSGLLVIDAVGWRSMYLIVMPRVNLIVILSTYACYLYSINCPTVICLPSMCYLSYGETPLVNCGPRSYFLYISITCLLYSHCLLSCILLLLSTRYAHSFIYSKPVRLATSS